jgi:hypothetical protein
MNNPQPWWHTWPVAEVAATILPLFSHPEFSRCRDSDWVLDDIVAWCKTGRSPESKFFRVLPGKKRFTDPDFRAINEAIQVLEHARLIVQHVSGGDVTSCYIGLTRLGWHALQTNTVRQHLGLRDATPTA